MDPQCTDYSHCYSFQMILLFVLSGFFSELARHILNVYNVEAYCPCVAVFCKPLFPSVRRAFYSVSGEDKGATSKKSCVTRFRVAVSITSTCMPFAYVNRTPATL